MLFFFLAVNKSFPELYFSKSKERHQTVSCRGLAKFLSLTQQSKEKDSRTKEREERKKKGREGKREERREPSIFSRDKNVSKVGKYKCIFHYIKTDDGSNWFLQVNHCRLEKIQKAMLDQEICVMVLFWLNNL